MTQSAATARRAQITRSSAGIAGRHDSGTAAQIGGYLRTATDQRQLQNVTASLGPHGGLRGRHAAVTAGYHLIKRHWNTVTLDGSVPDEVLELIGHAYDLVVAHLTRLSRAS